MFRRAAPTYGQVGPGFFSYFGRRLVTLAQIPVGARVLDVATGRGAVLVPAVEAVGPRGHVVGIDLAETMVHETSKALARLALPPSFELHTMDAEHLQFPDASFDHVLCGFGIFFFPQLDRAMSEFRRVLKPKGRLCVSTWGKRDDEHWGWFEDVVQSHLPAEAQPHHPHRLDAVPQPVFDTIEGLKAILTAGGFEDVQIAPETAEFVYSTSEEYWSTLWSHGTRLTLEEIERKEGTEGLQRFKMEVFGKLDRMTKADGLHEQFEALIGLATKPQE